jgi:uncharacterized RDD family membrane protein YckC
VSSSPTPELLSGSRLDNRRVGAALIDIAIMLPFLAVLYVLAGDSPAYPALAAAWALFYYFASESGAGQTLGKHLLGLRVVRSDGRPADMGAIAVRTALRLVDSLFGYLLGLLVMLRTGERRQRIGDLAARTVVTDARSAMATAGAPAEAAAAEDETFGEGFGAPGADAAAAEPEPTHDQPEPEFLGAPLEEVEPEAYAEDQPEPDFLGAPLEEVEPEAYEEPAADPEPEPEALEPPVEPDQLGVPLDEQATPVEYAWAKPEDEPEPEPEDEPEPEPEDVPAAEPQSAADLLFGDEADEQDEQSAS